MKSLIPESFVQSWHETCPGGGGGQNKLTNCFFLRINCVILSQKKEIMTIFGSRSWTLGPFWPFFGIFFCTTVFLQKELAKSQKVFCYMKYNSRKGGGETPTVIPGGIIFHQNGPWDDFNVKCKNGFSYKVKMISFVSSYNFSTIEYKIGLRENARGGRNFFS